MFPTTIVIDASSSMAFPLVSNAKWQQAQHLAVGLAAVARRRRSGRRCGTRRRRRIRVFPPRTRRGVVREISQVIEAADPDGLDPLAPAVASIRSARIAIITDLLGDAEELLRAAGARRRRRRSASRPHRRARRDRSATPRISPPIPGPTFQRLLVERRGAAISTTSTSGARRGEHRWRGAGAGYIEVVATKRPRTRCAASSSRAVVGGAREAG